MSIKSISRFLLLRMQQERLGRISSGQIIPFGDRQDRQDIILIHCDLSNPTVCKFIVN